MALKSEYKSIFKRSFKNLAELKQYDVEQDDVLLSLIDQMAETIYECQYDSRKSRAYKTYQDYQIKKALQEERNKALALKSRVVGI